MVYHLEKGGKGGEPVVEPEVAVTQPAEYDQQLNLDRYKTRWTVKIPEQGEGEVEYYLWVKINCGFKQTGFISSQLAQCPNQPVLVMAAQRNNQSLWERLLSIIRQLLTRQQLAPQPTITPIATITKIPTIIPNVTLYVPQDGESLQLGTFKPFSQPKIDKGCTWLRFWVEY